MRLAAPTEELEVHATPADGPLNNGLIQGVTTDDSNGAKWNYSGHPQDFGPLVGAPC